jgi:spore coat polysaccharide biosynthesis predicted glycosyltransferase SpsG
MKRISIITEAGEYVGMGHAVRMYYLYQLLKLRGHEVIIYTNEGGMEFFAPLDVAALPVFVGDKTIIAHADIIIVDVMNNDDKFLSEARKCCKKLVVIVGAGHTITNKTRWIADLVVYQTPHNSDLSKWVPGENILQGFPYIMMNPKYAEIDVDQSRIYDVLTYFGGGMHPRLSKALREALEESDLIVKFISDKWEKPEELLPLSKVFVGSMGMITYEAIMSKAYPIVFCRSEDHVNSAKLLEEKSLLTSYGMVEKASKESSISEFMENLYNNIQSIEDRYNKRWSPASWKTLSLDGKGIYRVALEILHD